MKLIEKFKTKQFGIMNFFNPASGETARLILGGKTRLEVMEETHPDVYEKMVNLHKKVQSIQDMIRRLKEKIVDKTDLIFLDELETLNEDIEQFNKSPYDPDDLSNLQVALDIKLTPSVRAKNTIAFLQKELDDTKAEAKATRPYLDNANPKPYVFVQNGIHRYFMAHEANLLNIRYSLKSDKTSKHVLELHDLIYLMELLTNGQLPEVRKKLNKKLGDFNTRTGRIRIKVDVAKDPDLALATVAHEIFHLIDWLPDHVIKRGKILGHIAALNKFMGNFIANAPGEPGVLTDDDKNRLMREARALLKDNASQLIDEEIVQKLGITPEDVLAIWNDAKYDPINNKDLYNFIASLSTNEKKSIIKEAMKIPLLKGLSNREVYDKYKELIKQEIEKRHLFENSAMMKELKAFTIKWSPFNPATASESYLKYRYSPAELYADAGSALLVNPKFLYKEAPHFFEAWFDYLEARPEVDAAYTVVMTEINSSGDSFDRVTKELLETYAAGEAPAVDTIKESKKESEMNNIQRIILFATAAILIVMLLFPPYKTYYQRIRFTDNAGYSFILSPPPPKFSNTLSSAQVNVSLLGLQFIFISIVGGILCLAFKFKKSNYGRE